MSRSGLGSTSSLASSASLGCSGKERGEDLQVLTAHERKFRVRSFIFFCGGGLSFFDWRLGGLLVSARWCDFGSVNVRWRVYVWWSQTSMVAGSRCGGIFFWVSGMGYHVMWTWMRQQTTNDEGDERVSKMQ